MHNISIKLITKFLVVKFAFQSYQKCVLSWVPKNLANLEKIRRVWRFERTIWRVNFGLGELCDWRNPSWWSSNEIAQPRSQLVSLTSTATPTGAPPFPHLFKFPFFLTNCAYFWCFISGIYLNISGRSISIFWLPTIYMNWLMWRCIEPIKGQLHIFYEYHDFFLSDSL